MVNLRVITTVIGIAVFGSLAYLVIQQGDVNRTAKKVVMEGCKPTGIVLAQKKHNPMIELQCDPEDVKKFIMATF